MDLRKIANFGTSWIGNIAKKHPALARVVEISFYGAILSVPTLLVFEDPKKALIAFLTAFTSGLISGVKKSARDQLEKK